MRSLLSAVLIFLSAALWAAEPVTIAFTVEFPAMEAAFLKVYADAGLEAKVSQVPGARAIAMIEDGSASGFAYPDSVFGKTFKSHVVKVGYGDKPLSQVSMVVWVRTADKAKLTDPKTWAKAAVGTALSSPGAKLVSDGLGLKSAVQAPEPGAAARMLAAGRFDLIILPLGLLETKADIQALGITTLDQPAAVIPYWHALPAKMAGTPAEAAIRAAFLKNRALLDKAFTEFFAK